jgi:hypothetical protein
MKSWPVVVFGATLVLLSPSFADEAAAPAPATDTKAAAQPDPEEMVCMRTKRTGSNMPGPMICKARKIWQQQHKDSQDLLNQQQKNGLLSQPAGG